MCSSICRGVVSEAPFDAPLPSDALLALSTLVVAEAHPTCAAALAYAIAKADSVMLQINRCMLEAPLHEEMI